MFLKRLFILAFVTLVSVTGKSQGIIQPKHDSLRTYTVKELKVDFAFFREAMETIHPSLYRYNSKDSVNKWFDDGLAGIDHPMNDAEFVTSISKILAKLGSGHTQISPRLGVTYAVDFSDHYMLPFDVYIHNNRLFVKNCVSTADTTFKTGDEIMAINNESAETLLTEMRGLVSGDGYSNNYKDFKLEWAFASVYKTLHVGQYQFFVTYRSGDILKRKLVKAIDFTKRNQGRLIFGDVVRARELFGPVHRVDYPYDIPRTAILKIRDFQYKKDYLEYHKQLFKTLKEGGIENLVIDLRDNTGGAIAITIDLMKYLMPKPFHFSLLTEWYVTLSRFNQFQKMATPTQPLNLSLIDHNLTRDVSDANALLYPYKDYNFKGNVYLLINNGSFSAAALFATAMKKQMPCTVIGQETGGGIAGCDGGTFADVALPNTLATLRMPLLFIYSANKQPDRGQGLKPDIEFYPTPQAIHEQVVKNTDPILPLLKATILSAK